MRIPSQLKKLFITVPFLLAIFLLAAAMSSVGATGSSAPFILPPEAYVPSGYTASFVRCRRRSQQRWESLCLTHITSIMKGMLP